MHVARIVRRVPGVVGVVGGGSLGRAERSRVDEPLQPKLLRAILVLPADAEDDPRLVRLLELLSDAKFRRELACLPGYDAISCGREVPLRVSPASAR